MPAELDLSGPERRLKELARALRTEENGKALRRDLMRDIRAAAQPARQATRQAIRSVTSQGHAGRSIRSAIGQKIQVVAKTSGPAVGARVVARETPNVRGFRHAPRRFNSAKGWRHKVFNTGQEVHQRGKPGWFDETLAGRRNDFRRAVVDAMKKTADRLAGKV
ncbi:hypothetical protein [Amycolatopsis methanolica]|uniref:Phage protein, HK97 gp10 family n=1 Tax=Amycolatopsis methanolica 239 TaxID=1068978 RepID=A0A076MYZ7_AMYME|nr:hypothetical protein [Amycolatopsis methanolica]AIJ26360.1 hypothetical protein AMETH_6268 [Amycolatopsis methanolica 239]AIJ26419.1 hypothetical protein AMETH_6327 [Amycolatopsis methanolica 239]